MSRIAMTSDQWLRQQIDAIDRRQEPLLAALRLTMWVTVDIAGLTVRVPVHARRP